jgi:hypothetical protein
MKRQYVKRTTHAKVNGKDKQKTAFIPSGWLCYNCGSSTWDDRPGWLLLPPKEKRLDE